MKKIITMLFFMTSAVFAAENYEIIVPNEAAVNNAFEIFNFVASLFQSSDYLSLLKMFALFGGFVAFVTTTIKVARGGSVGLADFAWYLAGITALLTVFGTANSTLVVKTNNIGSYYYGDYTADVATAPTTGVVIGNVPDIYAYGVSFFNKFDNEINDLFKMGLSSNTSYNIANYAGDMKGTMKLLQTDLSQLNPEGFDKLQAVIHDCVIMPMSKDQLNRGFIKEAIYETKNLNKTLDDLILGANAVRYDSILSTAVGTTLTTNITNNGVPYKDLFVSYNSGTYTCDQLWTEVKTISFSGMKQALARTHNDIGAGAVELLTGQAGVPQSAFEETAINAGLLNIVQNTSSSIANGELEYAAGKTKAEFVQSNIGNGYYMASMLPEMKIFFQFLLYALFPLIFAVSLMPGGFEVLKQYVKTCLWITMWGPTAAVLNYFITKQAESTMNELSIANAAQVMSDVGVYAGMAGYLYLSVPAISWLILTGSGIMLQGLGAGVAAKMNSNMDSSSMAKDHGRLTQQKALAEKRQEKVSLASMDQLEASSQAYSKAGELIAWGNTGGEKILAHSQLEKQSAIQGSHKKLLAGGGMNNAVDIEAKMNEKNFREGKGWQDQVNGDMNVANQVGRDKAIQDKATSHNLDKHGDTKLQNVANKTRSESTVKADTRFSEIEKTGNTVESFSENKTKVDFTGENAAANKFDMNGDGQTSDKELAKGAKVSDTQEKLDFFSKDRNQQELKKEAKDYKQSSSARIQNAMKGTPEVLGEMGQAAAAKVAANSEVSTFNDRKETKKVENFKKENVAPEKLAATESAEEMQKVKKVDSEVKTLGNNLGGVVGQYSELRDNVAEDLMSKGMSKFEAQKMANRQMLGALAEKGLAVGELTEEVLTGEISAINSKEEAAFNNLIRNEIGGQALGNLKNLEHSEKMLANQKPGSQGEKYWQGRVDSFNNNAQVNEAKVEELINGEKGQAIANKFKNERETTVKQFGNLVDFDNEGNAKYLDTMATVNSSKTSQDDKTFAIKQIKGSLDGMSVSTNDLKGMERKWVTDINGDNTTDMSRAEQSYIKTGNFEHGVMYEAGKSDIVSKENLAIGATAVNYTTKVLGTKVIRDKILDKLK